jgi:CPA2 family monovalent cation:H+ antiporter-2
MAGAEGPAFFSEAVVLLGAAVVAAPLFKRIGLETVLGYLAAGIVVGPIARIITDGDEILTVSELGVVFLLFIIGLELRPKRLWALRNDIFGLGLAQVVITGLALSSLILALTPLDSSAALVIGFGLALSSTAFALQMLEQRGEINSAHGQKTFSILLLQDIAIVPLLALIPLLAPRSADVGGSVLQDAFVAVGAVVTLILAGRYLLNTLFRVIAGTGAREAMLAAALLVVLGSAYLMHAAGLSMALGAFIAGVMLAESSYRHELEADIEPFRGLLLGLFFMAIGLSLDLGVIAENWLLILGCVPALMIVKTAIIYALCRVFRNSHDSSIRTALFLPQGGEFGFVMFTLATSLAIIDSQLASILVAIVTISMALTPLTVAASRFFLQREEAEEMEENFEGAGSDVLLIGFSRFGQIASQILLAGGSDVTIIDHSAERVRAAGAFGFRIYFGNGTRREVLAAAGVHRAKLVAICTNRRDVTDKIVDIVQSMCPNAHIYVRAYDRTHSIDLRNRGVDYEVREVLESGLTFGRNILHRLGMSEEMANSITKDVRRRDEARLRAQVAEGSIMAGQDMLHTRPVKPEPLTKPTRERGNAGAEKTESETEEAKSDHG